MSRSGDALIMPEEIRAVVEAQKAAQSSLAKESSSENSLPKEGGWRGGRVTLMGEKHEDHKDDRGRSSTNRDRDASSKSTLLDIFELLAKKDTETSKFQEGGQLEIHDPNTQFIIQVQNPISVVPATPCPALT